MNERCFGLKKGGACKVLTIEHCPGCGQCSFFKPMWMYERDLARAFYRVRMMPPDRQLRIAHKYYGGKMPCKRSENQ